MLTFTTVTGQSLLWPGADDDRRCDECLTENASFCISSPFLPFCSSMFILPHSLSLSLRLCNFFVIVCPSVFVYLSVFVSVHSSCYRSPLHVQLHSSLRNCPLPRLPRRLWEQHELRLAHPIRSGLQNSLSIQWLWSWGALRFPNCERWRDKWCRRHREVLWSWESFPSDFQHQHTEAGVSGWSLHVRKGI